LSFSSLSQGDGKCVIDDLAIKREQVSSSSPHALLFKICVTDLFTDTAGILNSIVSNSDYGMFRGQILTNFPLEHPIIVISNNGI